MRQLLDRNPFATYSIDAVPRACASQMHSATISFTLGEAGLTFSRVNMPRRSNQLTFANLTLQSRAAWQLCGKST